MSGLDTDEKRRRYLELMEEWLRTGQEVERLLPSRTEPIEAGKDITPISVDFAELQEATAKAENAQAQFFAFCEQIWRYPP